MAITKNSKIKEICENPEALALVQKYLPTLDPQDPKLKPALGMSLKTICAFPQTGIKKADANAMFEELEAANIE